MRFSLESKYWRQVLASNIACLILFVCASWVAWPSSVIKKLDATKVDKESIGLRLDATQISWMVALLDMGNAISPIFSSYIMNGIGRKNTLLLVALFFLPTWLIVWDSSSLAYVYTARFLVGVSKGLAFTAIPVYINELCDYKIRGMLTACIHSYMSMGVLFSLCIGPYITYYTFNIILSAIPLLFLVLFVLMPESPYYYIMKQDYPAAEKSLTWYKPYEPNIKETLQVLIDNHNSTDNNASCWSIIKKRSTRTPLITVMGVSFLQRMTGITALVAYSSSTLPKLSFSRFGPDECVICFMVAMVITNISLASCMDTMGRKTLLLTSIVCGGVLMSLMATYYAVYPKASSTYTDVIPYVLTVIHGTTYFGVGNVPPTLPSEYFTTSHRSFASAAASVSFAVGSFITSKTYFVILHRFGPAFIFYIFAFLHVFYFVFSSKYVIETKGKTLEEVQAIFYKKKIANDETKPPKGSDSLTL